MWIKIKRGVLPGWSFRLWRRRRRGIEFGEFDEGEGLRERSWRRRIVRGRRRGTGSRGTTKNLLVRRDLNLVLLFGFLLLLTRFVACLLHNHWSRNGRTSFEKQKIESTSITERERRRHGQLDPVGYALHKATSTARYPNLKDSISPYNWVPAARAVMFFFQLFFRMGEIIFNNTKFKIEN
jgi:hypothetical protein